VLLVAALSRLASTSQVKLSQQMVVTAAILGGVMLLHAPKDAVLSWGFNRIAVKTLDPQVESAGRQSAETKPSMKMLEMFPRPYVERISEGVKLLEKAGAKPGDVLLLGLEVDDVTIFTDLRYPSGGSPWWQFAFSKTPESYPLFKSDLLADTRWILQEHDDTDFWRFLMHHRGEYVRAFFAPVSESAKWTLWKRVGSATSGSEPPVQR
jgi:hypothetical protein